MKIIQPWKNWRYMYFINLARSVHVRSYHSTRLATAEVFASDLVSKPNPVLLAIIWSSLVDNFILKYTSEVLFILIRTMRNEYCRDIATLICGQFCSWCLLDGYLRFAHVQYQDILLWSDTLSWISSLGLVFCANYEFGVPNSRIPQ